jgi:hypothetical protein
MFSAPLLAAVVGPLRAAPMPAVPAGVSPYLDRCE